MDRKCCFSLVFALFIGFFLLCSSVIASESDDFQVALKAFSESFFDASEKLFRGFIEDYPESPKVKNAKLYIGKSLFFQKSFQSAEKIFVELVNNSTDEAIKASALYWLGRIHYEAKRYQQALEDFASIQKDYSDIDILWEAAYFKALSYAELKQEDKAIDTLLDVIKGAVNIELKKDSFKFLAGIYYEKKDYGSLQGLVKQWKEEFPQSDYLDYIYFYLAEASYYYQKYQDSVDLYKKALANLKTPNLDDLIRQGLGWAYVEQQEYEKAKTVFEKISSSETKMYSLAALSYNMQKYTQANDLFEGFIAAYQESHFINKVYLGKAESLYELGRVNDAIVFYLKVIDNKGNLKDQLLLKESYRGLGWCYLKLGDYKSAIEYFNKLSDFSDEEIVKLSAQVNIADVYQDSGQIDKALSIYEEILNKFPDNLYSDYIQLQIGICFLKQSDFEASLLAFNNLMSNFPDSKFRQDAVYYTALSHVYLGNFDQAIIILSDLIKNYPENKYLQKSYLLLIQVYTEKGNEKEALDVIKKASREFAEDKGFAGNLKLQKGMFLFDQGKLDLAADALKDLLSFTDDPYLKNKANFYLASIYHMKGDYEYAKKYYSAVIDHLPVSNYTYQARLNLAEILWQESLFDEARKLLEKNLSLAVSKDIRIQTSLMKIEFMLDQKNYQKAMDICDTLIKDYPEQSGLFYFKKANISERRRDYKNACEFYSEAEKKGYKDPELYYHKGYSLEKIGLLEEAVKSFFELTYNYPEKERFVVKAYLHIGKLYEKMGNPKEAKKAYQKVVDTGAEEKKYALQRIGELNKADNNN